MVGAETKVKGRTELPSVTWVMADIPQLLWNVRCIPRSNEAGNASSSNQMVECGGITVCHVV